MELNFQYINLIDILLDLNVFLRYILFFGTFEEYFYIANNIYFLILVV